MCEWNLQMASSQMEVEDNYDYSASEFFLERFLNPMSPSPFIDDDVENYGTLWMFKDAVRSWSFSKFGKAVQILLKVNDEIPYVHLNRNERVTFVQQQRREYIVLGIQAINSDEQIWLIVIPLLSKWVEVTVSSISPNYLKV